MKPITPPVRDPKHAADTPVSVDPAGRLDSPLDHVECHASRSIRRMICRKRADVKRATKYGYSLPRRNRAPGTRSAIRASAASERGARILACRPPTGAGLSWGAFAEDLSDFRSQAIYGKRFRQHGHAGR